jgi:type I restriction enzyme S subunit
MSDLGKYPLPKGWTWATIPDLVGETGVFVDGDWVESIDQDPSGNVRLIQLADVGDGVYRDKSERFMTKAKAEELRCTFLNEGDVLIARMPDPLGRACIFPGDPKPSVTVVDVAIARSGNGRFDHRWLACFVNAHPFRSAISELQAGSTRKRISRGNLATIPLPVPPLPEQRRIVAEIEKQFTRLEAGVTALRQVQANLKRYRAAVLKAACEGRLVPTEAELAKTGKRKSAFETGGALLARILTERRRDWKGRSKYKEPATPDGTRLPLLPDGWTWATAQQLNLSNRPCAYGVLQPGEHLPDGVPLVRVGDIGDGKVDLSTLKRISPKIAAQYPRTRLHGGELAITLVGAIGRTAVIPESLAGGNTARAVGIIPLTREANAHWVEIWFRNPAKTAEMDSKSHEVARKTLNLEDVRIASVAIPPAAEQTRIVAEVERRLSVVDELEAVVSANLQRATRLRQSILQKAFTGELV